MRILAAFFLLGASAMLAQTYFPPALKAYLALSDDQVSRMEGVKQQVAERQRPKFERQAALLSEIALENAKTAPDAAVLGPRYVEVELIRRDLDALQKSLVIQLRAILGLDQQLKLTTLQQALSLYGTACSAVDMSLLDLPPLSGDFSLVSPREITGVALVGYLGPAGCYASTAAYRTGDFSSTIQRVR